MDLLRLFTFRITFHSFVGVGIGIVLFAVLAGKTMCLDPQFVACEPRTCGVGPSISYPFWIADKQESYCGYPGFEIACEDRHPVLRIAEDGFTIRNIYHGNHSFLVANSAFYDEECPSPLHNFTLRRTPFSYSTFHADLFFFFNCTKTPVDYPTIPVNCASNASHSTFAVFHEDLLVRKYYSANTCTSSASAPVDVHGSVFRSSSTMNATKLLKEGFLLDWAAPNCSDCERSGGRCGFGNNTFLCFCRDGPSDKTCINGHGRDWVLKTVIGVVAAILGMGMMCLFFFLYQRRRNKRYVISSLLSRNISSGPSMKMDSEKGGNYMGVHIFTYAELEEATNNFDSARELGDGGFGTVYQGKLRDGRSVAVKRLYENNYRRLEQFMNEVEILTRLRHHNLVSLYGCTSRHSRELLLVYEYIPNGTVADHLHGDRAKSGPLTWPIRMSIALETASALSYLHASDIIHRDVKTNNILLDSNFCVKVADFGLSRLFPNDVTHISTAPQGTPGYVDPEYHQCYQLTDKSDVYSFGVVLMELISSKPAVDITRHRHEINLSNMAITKIQNHTLHELVDPCLGYETEYKARKMIGAVAELAFQCLQNEKEMRPSMEEVLETLNHIQSDGSNVEKAEEREGDVPGDDAVLLKSKALTLSPDTVTVNWTSRATTPNASN